MFLRLDGAQRFRRLFGMPTSNFVRGTFLFEHSKADVGSELARDACLSDEVHEAHGIYGCQVEVPLAWLGLLHDRLGGVIERTIHEITLLLLLHLHDDVSPVIGLARHIEDDSSLSLLMTCLLCFQMLHVLDYKLVLKYSVEERYETLLGVVTAEDALERPIDTWINVFRHKSGNLKFRTILCTLQKYGKYPTTANISGGISWR